ncbi:hypothetical protein D3C72_1649520 [compost metagenome]
MHVDGQRAAIAEGQVGLHALALAGDGLDPDREAAAARFHDPVGDFRGLRGHLRHAWQPRPQDVLVGAAIHVAQPLRALRRGQAVEDGDRGGDVGLQGAEHDLARGDVALGKQYAERQAMGDDEAGQQDQEQPRAHRTGPGQGTEIHWRASRISTGVEKT